MKKRKDLLENRSPESVGNSLAFVGLMFVGPCKTWIAKLFSEAKASNLKPWRTSTRSPVSPDFCCMEMVIPRWLCHSLMDRILHYLGWLFNTGQWAKWLVHQEVKNVSPWFSKLDRSVSFRKNLSMSSPFCSGEDRMFAKGFSIHRVWQTTLTTHLYGTQWSARICFKMYQKESHHLSFQLSRVFIAETTASLHVSAQLPSWIFSCDPKHDIFQGSCYLKMSCRSVEVVIIQGFILSFFESAPLSIPSLKEKR